MSQELDKLRAALNAANARLMAQLAELREKHERLVARLREPTDEMIHAVCAKHRQEPCLKCPGTVTTIYGTGTAACRIWAEDTCRAMSTVALRDSEGGE